MESSFFLNTVCCELAGPGSGPGPGPGGSDSDLDSSPGIRLHPTPLLKAILQLFLL